MKRLRLGLCVALVLFAGCGQGNGVGPTSPTSPPPPTSTSTTTAVPPTTSTTSTTTTTTTTSTSSTTTTSLPPVDAATYIERGRTDQNVIALTFDAGSDRGFAEQILDTLVARNLVITFGITGAWADQNPDLVARMAAEGHHIVNHSYTHPFFTQLTSAQRKSELERAEVAIAAAGGGKTRPWFRAPYGDWNADVNRDLAANGFFWNLGWTVDSLGWKGLTAAEITQRCLDRAAPGAIYLFHVGAQSQDANALVAIIDGLEGMGYEVGSALDVL